MGIITSIVGVLLGGGILAFIQFLITRHDNRHDSLKGIMDMVSSLSKKIDDLNKKSDERFAISSRVRILRFEDELQEGRKHSKDSWDQVMSDIDYYEEYCKEHTSFRNNQTVATVEHIQHGYRERLEKRDFTY